MVHQGALKGRPLTRSNLKQQQQESIKQNQQPTTTRRSSTLSTSTIPNRLSTSSNKPKSPFVTPKLSELTETLQLHKRLIDQLFEKVVSLEKENILLTTQIQTLTTTVKDQQEFINSSERAVEAANQDISPEQQELNDNIVIRGLEVDKNSTEAELLNIYQNLCVFIGIAGQSDAEAVSAQVVRSDKDSINKNRPIIVKLKSEEAKRRFLQARRIKKDIRPSDLGFKANQTANKPIFVTEHLTSVNQKLLFEARSLRDKFKFVWSNNGKILVRRKKRASVIRIRDSFDVERLKASTGSTGSKQVIHGRAPNKLRTANKNRTQA